MNNARTCQNCGATIPRQPNPQTEIAAWYRTDSSNVSRICARPTGGAA